MPPSRQERRSAKRDAAKRAPAQAGAAGAAAAAAPANSHVNVNLGGDWRTQNEDPMLLFQALGAANGGHGGEEVRQKADQGDRDAQYSVGYMMIHFASEMPKGSRVGAAGRSPEADVGLACTENESNVPDRDASRCSHLCDYVLTSDDSFAGASPGRRRAWRFWRRRRGKGTRTPCF